MKTTTLNSKVGLWRIYCSLTPVLSYNMGEFGAQHREYRTEDLVSQFGKSKSERPLQIKDS